MGPSQPKTCYQLVAEVLPAAQITWPQKSPTSAVTAAVIRPLGTTGSVFQLGSRRHGDADQATNFRRSSSGPMPTKSDA